MSVSDKQAYDNVMDAIDNGQGDFVRKFCDALEKLPHARELANAIIECYQDPEAHNEVTTRLRAAMLREKK